jgi:type IV secretory pathway VirB10-like protein
VKIERIQKRGRMPLFLGLSASCAAVLLAGCMSSPTYGTGKTANQQLVDDVTGILALGPQDKPQINYTPRGQLVRPSTTTVLPEPQQELASAENPAWPESPEQRRRRIREEADEMGTAHPSVVASTNAQRVELQRRVRENNQGEATNRRYLSEPPLTYRQPSANAAAGDLGDDEWKKERSAKRASGKSSWRDYVPWL